MLIRARIIIEGIVQGVGFRPFVHRLADSFNLPGWVKNSSKGLIVEVEGNRDVLNEFYYKIISSPPPLTNIMHHSIEFHPPIGMKSFVITQSSTCEDEFTPVSPDIGICKDCCQELLEPGNRRYQYPFINCTNCGPRFTIIQGIPYDREKTTMKRFKMCKECQSEYTDISNRRYHAEPNACKVCGPKIWLSRQGQKISCPSPIKEATKLLKAGYLVAIKGLGGFHLACNAEDDKAVTSLRSKKRREISKPFAIMSKSLAQIRKYCVVSQPEERLLLAPARPIVLLKRKKTAAISVSVSPNNNYLGVMLPYTSLHCLLLDEEELLALVMTSGNLADEPLVKDNLEAKKQLSAIADYILMHNRDIYNRCDDSVTQIVGGQEVIIRRSRGYAPSPIRLGFELNQVLAVGAELKSTFCLSRGNLAFLSQHIGDLKNLETLNFFQEGVERYKKLFQIEPEVVAYDLHPDYLSTKFAEEYYSLLPTPYSPLPVQHHHAHIAGCLADNELDEKVIGVAMDGIGYGTDGRMWGGEFLLADYLGFERVAHLKYVPMPGGDKATEEPFRMAISYLHAVYGQELPVKFLKRWGQGKTQLILSMIEQEINSPLTSSAGRLFDAVAAILGIREVVDYEAQAAVELEMIAAGQEKGEYNFQIFEEGGVFIIDPTPTILNIVQDINQGTAPSLISARFHNTVISFTLDICQRIRGLRGINKVALSGGVFQNRYLLERIKPRLQEQGFVPILHRRVPPNDGGISLGQAVIASRKIASKEVW